MAKRTNDALGQIHMQIMWNRLIAVVEEQAQTLVRTAFSTSVREAGDLSAGVFDRKGRMLAQAVTGTPGHVNAMAEAVVHFLAKFPIDEMRPGDVFLTNDPWQTSGHLHDITFVTPTFRKGRAVALFANTTHVVDIGGRGFGPDAKEVYEEGLHIPIMHLFRAGKPNETLPPDLGSVGVATVPAPCTTPPVFAVPADAWATTTPSGGFAIFTIRAIRS